MFFDNHAARESPDRRFPERALYVSEWSLARYYGIEDVKGPEFRRVELKTEERGGILSQGSVLAVSSYPSRTSVVIRGKYILQNILGTPPPPPPPDVPPLDEGSVGTAMSLRQQMEKHRANAFVLPAIHGWTRWASALKITMRSASGARWTASSRWIRAACCRTERSFTTPAEMREMLTGSSAPEFARCLTEKMLAYALGRGLATYDRRTVDAISRDLAASGYPFQSMIYEIVRSLPFESRRGEAAKQASK